MQKLNVKGSVLIGVIAFSVILSVASLAYLQISATASHNEIESLRDARAFQAAESGLLLGARWLSQQGSIPGASLDDLYTLTFGEITVTVDLVAAGADQADIQATATTSKLPYDKRLSWMMGLKPAGVYGTFLNGILGNNHRAQGGFIFTTFDGPTHSNEPYHISAAGGNVVTRFLDRATVHHTEADHWDYGDGTHDNNNYDFGVEIAAHGGPFLDQKVFKSAYRHHEGKITLPPRVEGQDVILPPSDPVASPNSDLPQKRALLKMNGTQATYYFWKGGALDSFKILNTDNKIIRAQNELCVAGIVQGKTTVVTDPGFNLYPVGDVVYSDFVPDAETRYDDFDHQANYGVPAGSDNALALVSGKDIFFAAEWFDPFSQSVQQVEGALGDPLYVTASLIAAEQGGTHRLVTGPDNKVKANRYAHSLQKAGIRIIGSRSIDHWFQVNTGSFEFLRLFYDRRLEKGCQAPGIPKYRREPGDGSFGILLSAGRWKEENIAD